MWKLALAGLALGTAITYFASQVSSSDKSLKEVGGDAWKTLQSWNKLMGGELSSVGVYLAQMKLMHAIGETYLRIEQAKESGQLRFEDAERLHQGLIKRVKDISGQGHDHAELLAQSVALASYVRKHGISKEELFSSVFFAEEVLDKAKEEAVESGLYDEVYHDTDRRLAYLQDLEEANRNQVFRRIP